MALFPIAYLCGEATAVRIRKLFLFGDRSAKQLPDAAMNRRRDHDDGVVAEGRSGLPTTMQRPTRCSRWSHARA